MSDTCTEKCVMYYLISTSNMIKVTAEAAYEYVTDSSRQVWIILMTMIGDRESIATQLL